MTTIAKKTEFEEHTTEQLEETIRCMNYLFNMEFNNSPFDQSTVLPSEITDFRERVEEELKNRKKR